MKGTHIVVLSWRDAGHPEAGGAERYLSHVVEGLVERGAHVTLFSSAYQGAAADETTGQVRFVRRGGRFGVYLWGMLLLLTGRLGRPDVVIDVQNGLPFFTRIVTRAPVVVLVHHVHREQWQVVYRGWRGRVGWWLESWLSPRLYRHDQYVTVSEATRTELARLGVDPARSAVVHNGLELSEPVVCERTAYPSILVVGRLVPHKRVEHAIDALALLRTQIPGLTLRVVGEGWWEQPLREYADNAGVAEAVEFTGHLDEADLARAYAQAWVQALPSVKEGWGLVITEAGASGTPTVAYRSAGGTTESIIDGVSGLLADDEDGFVAALRSVLTDDVLRKTLAEGARWQARRYTWGQTQTNFAAVLEAVMAGSTVSAESTLHLPA